MNSICINGFNSINSYQLTADSVCFVKSNGNNHGNLLDGSLKSI